MARTPATLAPFLVVCGPVTCDPATRILSNVPRDHGQKEPAGWRPGSRRSLQRLRSSRPRSGGGRGGTRPPRLPRRSGPCHHPSHRRVGIRVLAVAVLALGVLTYLFWYDWTQHRAHAVISTLLVKGQVAVGGVAEDRR